MTTYVDTSALVPVYITEAHSRRARHLLAEEPAIPFTPLHQLELRNAFEALVARRLLSGAERDALVSHVWDDHHAGRLADAALDWQDVFSRAQDLAGRYTRRHLSRSLDLLHLACAQELGCTTFVSGDQRQLKVARALKLRAIDITRGGRSKRLRPSSSGKTERD